MPGATAERLSEELRKAVANPDIQKKLVELSAEPVGSTAGELAGQLKAEIAKWQPIIEKVGLKGSQ